MSIGNHEGPYSRLQSPGRGEDPTTARRVQVVRAPIVFGNTHAVQRSD